MAEAVLERAVERFRPEAGWNLFVDVQSFRKLGTHLGDSVPEQVVARAVGRPFRNDMEATALFRPHERASSRWGGDPWAIQVDSVRGTGAGDRASVFVSERYNMRLKENVNASAAMGAQDLWEYTLERRRGVWVVVNVRMVSIPF